MKTAAKFLTFLSASALCSSAFAFHEGDVTVELRGRVFTDAAFYFNDWNGDSHMDKRKLSNGVEIRQARVGIQGKIGDDFRYVLETDFAQNSVSIKDAFLTYLFSDCAYFTVGHFRVPISVEDQTSSKYITFMERANPVQTFALSRRAGAKVHHYNDAFNRGSYTVDAGVFGRHLTDANDSTRDEAWFAASRLTGAYGTHSDCFVMLGGAYIYGDNTGRFTNDNPTNTHTGVPDLGDWSVTGESHYHQHAWADTGAIPSVTAMHQAQVEGATVIGPFSAQGEYYFTTLKRRHYDLATAPNGIATPDTARFHGWYAFVSFFPTGEHRNYKFDNANFSSITPHSHYGAVEVAGRWSHVNLNDSLDADQNYGTSIRGGKIDSYTFGLNWYLNKNVRTMLNIIKINASQKGNDTPPPPGFGPTQKQNPWVVQMRTQFHV